MPLENRGAGRSAIPGRDNSIRGWKRNNFLNDRPIFPESRFKNNLRIASYGLRRLKIASIAMIIYEGDLSSGREICDYGMTVKKSGRAPY